MNEQTEVKKTKKDKKMMHGGSHFGAVYFFGLIGAAIYFISNAAGFWIGVLGFLKALVWPVFLVLELFKYLGT